MSYTATLISDKMYQIEMEKDEELLTFFVVVAEDESEIPGLVEHHINCLTNPPSPPAEPEPLTAEQKLKNAGLSVEELKELLGL